MQRHRSMSWGSPSLLTTLLLFISQTPFSSLRISQAMLIKSISSGSLATGLAYDHTNDMAIVVGTTYQKEFMDISDDQPIECFVAVGSASPDSSSNSATTTTTGSAFASPSTPFTQVSIDNPRVCVGGVATFPDQQQQQQAADGINTAQATVVGLTLAIDIHNPQSAYTTSMHTVEYTQNSQVTTRPTTHTFSMPFGALPVATASNYKQSSDSQDVYIAFHNISDGSHVIGQDLYFASTSQPSITLSNLLKYWLDFNNEDSPILSTEILTTTTTTTGSGSSFPTSSPHIVKKNIQTGAVSFRTVMDTALGQSVIAGMAVTQKDLLVVGSTNGIDVGNHVDDTTSYQPYFGVDAGGGDDWDGYITFLDPETGTLSTSSPSAIRIQSTVGSNRDDFVNGLCLDPSESVVYIVGSTNGIIRGIHQGGAFLLKIDLSTREIVWRYQVSGVNVQGWKCVADSDSVYIGGTTESDIWSNVVAGGENVDRTPNPDAFVTRIDATTGVARWTRPLDTSIEELDNRMEVIVGMELNAMNNVVVVLNSMDLEKGQNDIFLLDLKKETGANDLKSLEDLGIDIPTFNEAPPSKLSRLEENEVKIVAIVIPLVVAIVLAIIVMFRRRNSGIEKEPNFRQAQDQHKPYHDNDRQVV